MPISFLLWALLIVAAVAAWRITRIWLKYRGQRVITCPENHLAAGVSLDSKHVIATAFGKSPELRLSECTRWPERAGCGQECLSEIKATGAECLVRNIIAKWYQDKNCAVCGQPIGEIDWAASQPALITGNQVSVEWKQIPVDKLKETLAGSLPICFACHTTNRLVKEHPELVIDRHRPSVIKQ